MTARDLCVFCCLVVAVSSSRVYMAARKELGRCEVPAKLSLDQYRGIDERLERSTALQLVDDVGA